MQELLATRDAYVADGRMRLSRGWILFLVPLVSAIIVAYLLYWLFVMGWFLIMIAPLAGGGLVAGSMAASVHLSHCRKPLLAMLIGLCVGAIAYLGYYHFTMIRLLPPGHAHRIDLLPDYVKFRMATDVQREVGRDQNGNELPSPFMNWFTFGYEGLIVIAMAALAGRFMASRAYDANNECWLNREPAKLYAGARDDLENALAQDELSEFCESHPPLPPGTQGMGCDLTLEYVKRDDLSPLECPIYLTATEQPFRTFFRKLVDRNSVFNQKALRPVEALELQPLFPAFTSLCRSRHKELKQVVVETPGSTSPGVMSREATENATIETLNQQDQLDVTSMKHLTLVNLAGGFPLGLIAVGAGVGYLAYICLDAFGALAAIGCGLIACIFIIAGIYISLCCPFTPERLYTSWALRSVVDRRSGKLLDPDDDDVFRVGLTLRENWQKIKLDTVSDAGFARIDHDARQLLMECGRERFRIPFDSIESCWSESFSLPIDASKEAWMVCIVVHSPEEDREIILADTTPSWRTTTNASRQQSAQTLCAQLMAG